MTKLPKTLRDKRDAMEFFTDDSRYYLNIGYDACFSDMSEAVQGLLSAAQILNDSDWPEDLTAHCNAIVEGLKKYREFVGGESDEE